MCALHRLYRTRYGARLWCRNNVTRATTRTLELALEPVDNHQLASLCGPLDENLRQIEQCFDVTLARRSAHFKIQGMGASREHAAKALRFFYDLAGSNKDALSVDDIQLG